MKRGLIKGMKISAVTAIVLFALSSLAVFAAEYVSVAKDGVNLRSGPGTNYEAIFQLPANYPLQVLAKKDKWIKISDYEGDKGWIYGSLVSSTPYVIVKVNEGNVRKGAGTNNGKVGTVARDVILKKVGQKGEWFEVSHPEIQGWVHKNLVWP